jgi:hypothetical protein
MAARLIPYLYFKNASISGYPAAILRKEQHHAGMHPGRGRFSPDVPYFGGCAPLP